MTDLSARLSDSSTRIALVGNLTGCVIGVWVAFLPWPQLLAILAAALAPLVAISIVAASRGAISLGSPSPANKRPSLLMLGAGPAVGLGWRAFHQFQLLYFTETVWLAVGVCFLAGGVTSLLVSRADRQEMGDGTMMLASGALGLAWALGLTAMVNADLPARQVVFTPGAVIDKKVVHHSRSGDSYNVTVGTPAGQETFPVDLATYAGLSLGDPECVARKEGVLKIWWRDFGPCPASPPREPQSAHR